ncbi:MAG: 3-hydroxybutyryl-CoA dehydratase [Conexibacter sp.]|nr:3-hydroxybutyryl-CoA dehydratase [Conexibacter sp.]
MTEPLVAPLVHLTVQDGVALVRLNRLDKRNALNEAMISELEDALDGARRDDEVRVIVIAGSEKVFCAGGDISMFTELNSESGYAFTRRGFDLLRVLETTEKPVIAAVDGYCLAGGFEIALACDFIIAGTRARFGFGEVDLGLIPGWGGTVRAARALPVRRARQLIMTSERIDADEAHRLGAVNEVVEAGQAEERAVAIAQELAGKPPLAIKVAKMTIAQADDATSIDAALAVERSACAALFGTDDVKRLAQRWIDAAARA